ncbi:MAG: diguanylate cyclase, partial [Solirubrobacteraceae bacterium]|nr:diguanylate cyclase [Solirubrobacteraceae bacterium]
METLPPASAQAHVKYARTLSFALVLLIMAATVGVAERARGMADTRRQAQVELRRAQAASQQLRAIVAEAAVPGGGRQGLGREGFDARSTLIASIARLRQLDVNGPAADRLEKAMGDLYAGATPPRGASQQQVDQVRRASLVRLDPMLDQIIIDTEAQMTVEDHRARHATTLARAILAAGILIGLLALGLLVRRFEAVARQGRAELMLRRQAFTDALTGLPNRAALEIALAERLRQTQSQSLADETGSVSIEGNRQQVAMALLDVDDLKTINDSLG